jgi:hypothetical protein
MTAVERDGKEEVKKWIRKVILPPVYLSDEVHENVTSGWKQAALSARNRI